MSEKNKLNESDKKNQVYNEDFSDETDFSQINVSEDVPESASGNEAAPNHAEPEEEYTYTSRKERGKTHKRRKNGKSHKKALIAAVTSASAVVLLSAAFFCLPLTLTEGQIASNVYSGDTSLGGMSISAAAEALAKVTIPENIDFSVNFTHDEKTVEADFSSGDISFAVDSEKTAEEAYNFGRSGNIAKNSWDILCSLFSRRDIGLVPSFDEEALSEILYNLGAEVYGESTDMQCVVENNTLTITPPTPGQSHNVSEAIAEFVESVRSGVYTDIPVTLKDNENDKIDADELYEKLAAEPKNAEYVINGNEVTITEHVVGLRLDKAKLRALVEQVNDGITGSIEVEQLMPEVTTEQLRQSLFGTTLASFSSNYASSSANRAYNVELAASKINGIILADGAEFSYNAAVGNANAANGFKMATIFSNGKVTEGIGGGVCQISSTLYCAVLRSDLQVTERHNHSLPIGYVPGGQDATVSYGTLDFKFKNNTGAPIKIVTVCENRNVTVSIVGNAAAKKNVEVVSEKVATIAPTTTQVNDPTLPAGQTKVITAGKAGSVYMTYKRVYDASGALVSETKTKSSYKATPGETAVGTKAVSASVPAAPSAPRTDTAPAPSSPQKSEEPAVTDTVPDTAEPAEAPEEPPADE